MTVPPLLLAAALAFWGWRSGNYAAAAAMALAVEAPRVVGWRLDFRHAEFTRVAEACTVFFAGMVIWFFVSFDEPRTARAVLTALLWLPAVLLPVLLAQRFSAAGRLPLSALFRYLRKQKARDPSTPDPEIDLSGVYFAVCLVAAGIPNVRDGSFYGAVVALAAWAAWAVRPRHAPRAAWAAMLVGAAALGFGTHKGLSELQEAMEAWVGDWMLRGLATDPYRASTDLGAVGRLKEIEAIVLRVYAGPEDAERVKLLHRASYTTLAGTSWVARNAPLAPLEPEQDGSTWRLSPATPEHRLRIVTRLEDGKAVLALPAGTARLSAMPALGVRRNAYGATSAELGGDWAPYVAEYGAAPEDYAPPRPEDLEIPEGDRPAFARFSALRGRPEAGVLEAVRRHFASYSYSTYREAEVPRGSTPLADFLERARSGHCEYFAGATTLALRAAGIPARYATGFAMVERSELEEAYVVRARHAHAWARAYVGGRWIDVDTTPPSWVAEEARRAPAWQGLMDFARWLGFRWSQRGAIEGGAWWTALVAVLAAILAWRILRGRKALRRPGAAAARAMPGEDSELYALLARLEARHGPREPGETLAAWLRRRAVELPERLVRLHERHRFDPKGLDREEREALRSGCLALARSLR